MIQGGPESDSLDFDVKISINSAGEEDVGIFENFLFVFIENLFGQCFINPVDRFSFYAFKNVRPSFLIDDLNSGKIIDVNAVFLLLFE